jgi:hypothetical protein
VIPQLYEVADSRDLPLAAQGESTACTTGCGHGIS